MKRQGNQHARRSIRYRDYDYTQPGRYFVTLCVQDRNDLFGEVVDGHMHLSEEGFIIVEEWLRTGEIRDAVELDAWVVMSDHMHAIVRIFAPPSEAHGRHGPTGQAEQGAPLSGGTDPRGDGGTDGHAQPPGGMDLRGDGGTDGHAQPPGGTDPRVNVGAHGRAPLPPHENHEDSEGYRPTQPHTLHRPPRSLGSIIAGFKAASTRRVNQLRRTPGRRLWQRNYYERILTDEAAVQAVRRYIRRNPIAWERNRK